MPFLEPTTAMGLVRSDSVSIEVFVVLAGETDSIAAAGVIFEVEIKGFSDLLLLVTDWRPRPKEATAIKTSKTL